MIMLCNFGQTPLFSVLLLFVATSVSAAGQPNIVIIYTDDHAQHAVSAYGSKINSTPNIDAMARDGMKFTRSFVANSICGPCRATLLTGLHSHANGQTGNRAKFRDELPSFAKSLQASGYATAMVGKWHISTPPNGFDYWAIKKGSFYNSNYETTTGVEPSVGHATDTITDRSLNWMAEHKDGPFMLWICHSAAHRTWEPPIRHLNKYADQDIPEPKTLFDDYSGKNVGARTAQMRVSRDLFPAYDLKLPVTGKGILDNAAGQQLKQLTPDQRTAWDEAFGPRNAEFEQLNLKGDDLTRWNFQRYIKNYLRNVDGLDDSVGKVRDFLSQNDLEKNTIVIYSSDQGFFLGDHGWYDKRWMYEESLRTPLIVHWPGVTSPGSTCDSLVQNIDMAPTFLEMAGRNVPESMHGESLVPLLQGETPDDWRDAIYYHYQMEEPNTRTAHRVARHYGIRTAKHKLIYFYDLKTWELYDLDIDPTESRNQYDRPEYLAITNRLKQQLQKLRTRFADTSGVSF
jgi:arylsulfatase A-like enzyme